MKRASYKDGIMWIALNDNNGSEFRLNKSEAASRLSTSLLADLFGKPLESVANDIVSMRIKLDRGGAK